MAHREAEWGRPSHYRNSKRTARPNGNGGKPNAAKAATAKQDTVFTHPAPAGAAQRTVASTLGEIVWLMSQSKIHKSFFISDLEWMIMVPVMLQQFRIFYDQQKPIGVALWGFVNDEVETRLAAGNARLKPQDWKSGDKLWVVEIIAPFGGQDEMLKDLRSQVFATKTIHFVATEQGKRAVQSV